ncbi:hypothetical protein WDW89_08500 [Deltaproteobacteria bacterium TL4]
MAYLSSMILFPLTQTDFYFQETWHYYWGFFPKKNIGFDLFSVFAVIVCSLCIYLLFKNYRSETDSSRKRQLFYFFWSEVVIIFLNLENIPAINGVELYPLGNFTFLPILLQGYALLQRYQSSVVHLFRKSLHYGFLLGLLVSVSLVLEKTLVPVPVIILGCVLGFRPLNHLVERLLSLVFPTELRHWKRISQDLHIKS